MPASPIPAAALVRDTFREALARWIFLGFLASSTALILFFLFLMKIDVVEGALATISLFGTVSRTQDVHKLIREVHGGLAAFLYGAAMFPAVFASAGLIPAIFEPGRIELLLSKPVRRWQVLLGRYAGNLLVVACNLVYLVVPIWVIFGCKTGVWTPGFLYSAVVTLFMFAVLLTVVTFVSVLTANSAVATMATFAVMIVSPILAQKTMLERLLSSEWSRNVMRALYYSLPKVFDCGRAARRLVIGEPVADWMPFWSSALFAAVMLAMALYCFARRDY